MPRSIISVVIDKVISLVPVKIRGYSSGNEAEVTASNALKVDITSVSAPTVTANVNISDAAGNALTSTGNDLDVNVKASVLPTGAATSALQTSSEAILTTIDADTGTIAGDTTSIDSKTPALGAALTADSVPVNIASDQDVPVITKAPERVTSDLGAACVYFDHGTVVANFAADSGSAKTQSASYNLNITSLHINLGTDPTTELATQPIFLDLSVYDVTDSQWRFFGSLSIPGNQQIEFGNSPLFIAAGHQWYTRVNLGGATDLSIFVTVNGFEEAV